jgi:segregation and condensation protein B
MQGIKKRELEAILFLENMPITIEDISRYLEITQNECVLLIESLIEEYSKVRRGIEIIHIAGGYQMVPAVDLKERLIDIYSDRKKSRLTKSSLETLAIVAWNQPITKAEIENIRGVDCANSVKQLVEKELIEEKGRKEVIGRPILYGTTQEFLRYFGLKRLEDLPPLNEIKNIMFRPIKKGEIKNETTVGQEEIEFPPLSHKDETD